MVCVSANCAFPVPVVSEDTNRKQLIKSTNSNLPSYPLQLVKLRYFATSWACVKPFSGTCQWLWFDSQWRLVIAVQSLVLECTSLNCIYLGTSESSAVSDCVWRTSEVLSSPWPWIKCLGCLRLATSARAKWTPQSWTSMSSWGMIRSCKCVLQTGLLAWYWFWGGFWKLPQRKTRFIQIRLGLGLLFAWKSQQSTEWNVVHGGGTALVSLSIFKSFIPTTPQVHCKFLCRTCKRTSMYIDR